MRNQTKSSRSPACSVADEAKSKTRKSQTRCYFCLAMCLLLTAPGRTQQSKPDLGQASIEDLMNMEVTSVSKKEQKLSRIASAVFVITQEDIRHSGATNIPDLLREVPGLDVAQVNGSTWEISSRGFNSLLADKLLVLIDGRTVYTPLFAGVYWDVQDVPLEDIDRIEVIRGPGASVWGANAVNGVINIITKSAKETRGGLVTAGSGTHEPGFGVAQYGGKLFQATDYRFFVKGYDNNSFPSLSGQDGKDSSQLLHAGFRTDTTLSSKDSLTVQGDMYKGNEGEVVNIVALTPPYGETLADRINVSGGNILGRWNHTFSPSSDTTLQIYYDQTDRSRMIENEDVHTFDIDFQNHIAWGRRQDFVWGVGYRYFSYVTVGSLTASFNPPSGDKNLFTTFVQDEIALTPDRLYLTLGAKVEHNDFTGFVFQPSARIAWNVSKNNMLWAGYSRARRTPSPVDRGVNFSVSAFPGPGGIPILASVEGSLDTVNEDLDAFETGYRTQIRQNISLDLAVFYNQYGNLNTFEPAPIVLETNPLPPHLDSAFIFSNQMHGESHGLEMSVNWKLTPRWTLSPGYAFERIHLHTDAASQDISSVANGEGDSPHVQAQLRSTLTLPRKLDWNTSVYFVGRLAALQGSSYTRLDTGITWRAHEHLSISLVGQNLLRNEHVETSSSTQTVFSSEIKRSGYVKFTWQF